MKPVFNAAEIELIRLAAQDVIVTSVENQDDEFIDGQPEF